MSECVPERGQNQNQPCSRPPTTPPPPIWTSRRCITVECPEGTVGQSVTVCADATSEISQADADARAQAAAEDLADVELICSSVESAIEEATLDLNLTGSYDTFSLAERATLNLSLNGSYTLAGQQENAALMLNLTGEYLLIPFEELASLRLALYPLSEYRLLSQVDVAPLHVGLRGSYDSPIIPIADNDDQALLNLDLRGSYNSPVVSHSEGAAASLDLDLSGSYTLKSIMTTEQEQASLDANLSGNYVFRIIDLGSRTERNSLAVGLARGSYT